MMQTERLEKKRGKPKPNLRSYERSRETVLISQCPECKRTLIQPNEGAGVCSCGVKFYMSESEGILPNWSH